MRAKAPRFKPGIAEANIVVAKRVIDKLSYGGPISLSWDDTALEPALAVYQESKDGICTILGSTQGIIEINSETELDAAFDTARKSKANKVLVTNFLPL
jgi:hypothetical protein